jgi:putative transposase
LLLFLLLRGAVVQACVIQLFGQAGDLLVKRRRDRHGVAGLFHPEIAAGTQTGDLLLLVSIVPQVSVSKLIQKLKGKSCFKLQREFASLRKQYWGQRMWARGYFACSTGNVTDEMIKDYIHNHSEKDDDFHVE